MNKITLRENARCESDTGQGPAVLQKGDVVYSEKDVELFESDLRLIMLEDEKERDTLWKARNDLQARNVQLRCCANCTFFIEQEPGATYCEEKQLQDASVDLEKKHYADAACEHWRFQQLVR